MIHTIVLSFMLDQHIFNYSIQHVEDREKKNAYMRAWRAANPEKVSANFKRYREAHKDELHEYNKKYRQEKSEELRAKKATYVKENSEKVSESTRKSKLKLKQLALQAYGGEEPECECCGETEECFLQIDHIHGGGSKHRESMKINAGTSFYSWLKKEGYPAGYRVLCGNCNNAIHIFNSCPHENPGISTTSFVSKLRMKVVKEYAKTNGCACCGPMPHQFLCIDHIGGRKQSPFPGKGYYLYRWLIEMKFPVGFQALCWNCNFAKWVKGRCPHEVLEIPYVTP